MYTVNACFINKKTCTMMIKMMMAEAFILSGADWRSKEVGWMASEEEHFASDTPDHPCQHSRG